MRFPASACPSFPRWTIVPLVGSSKPRIILAVVDFPQPLSPASENISAGLTWNDTLSVAVILILERRLPREKTLVKR